MTIGKTHPTLRNEVEPILGVEYLDIKPIKVKVQVDLCWIFKQDCFLGEMERNPENGLLVLDRMHYDCNSRVPNSTVNIC